MLILPEGIKEIYNGTFCGCISVENITLPESIEKIGTWSLAGISVESIRIPDGVPVLALQALSYCDRLSTVYLPKSIKTIEKAAFLDCVSLSEIIYDGTLEEWSRVVLEPVWFTNGENYLRSQVTVKCADGEVIMKYKSYNEI